VSSPTSFDTRVLQRSLGVRDGPDLPGLDMAALQPTILVGDTSKNFASQQFEARAFGTVTRANIALEVSVAQLVVNAPGGVVVERIDIQARDAVGVAEESVGLQVAPPSTLNNLVAGIVQPVGGTPTESVLRGGTRLLPGVLSQIFLDAIGQKVFENFGWFVASGSTLNIVSEIDRLLFVTIQWREIPQAPGA